MPENVGLKLDPELLTQALQSLPHAGREVLTLRKIEGLPEREIAARPEISYPISEVQVTNGMRHGAEFLLAHGVLAERKDL